MELTPSVLLGLAAFILTLLTAFAAIVGGFVRGESKTNQNTSDISDLYERLERHTESRDIHPAAKDLDRRFALIEHTMQEIKTEIKEGVAKLNDRFNDFISGK